MTRHDVALPFAPGRAREDADDHPPSGMTALIGEGQDAGTNNAVVTPGMARLRERRLLELQNERLLGEILSLRRDKVALEIARANLEARISLWENSRRHRYATMVAHLVRGSARERMNAAKTLFRTAGAAAARHIASLGRAPGDHPPASSGTVAHWPPPTDPWVEWQAICGNPASSDALRQIRPHGSDGPLRIALIYSGGLGDVLQAGVIAAAVKQDFAPCAITFFHNNRLSPAILGGNNNIETVALIPPDYKHVRAVLARLPVFDLIVDYQYCIRYIVPPDSRVPGSLIEEKILSAAAFARPWLLFMDDFPWRNNQLGRAVRRAGLSLLDIGGLSGALDVNRASPLPFFPDMNSYDTVLGLVPHPYVTVHNGVDGRSLDVHGLEQSARHGYLATKLLPMPTWINVVRSLKQAGFSVAQIGLANEEIIPGVTHDLRGLTSVSEVALAIKNSACHVDTEGGMVHLARAVNRRSVVMFGPTPASVFGYDQNINISSSSCTDCWWITHDWLNKCPRGTAGPECMADHAAIAIVDAVRQVAAASRVPSTELLGAQLFTIDGMRALESSRHAIYTSCGLRYDGLASHAHQPESGIYVHASKNWEYPFVLKAMRDAGLHPGHGLRVADVGGGRGALSFALGRMGAEAEVFDIDFRWDSRGDPGIEDRFIQHFRQVGHARFGSIFNIPADDASFDVVTCISVVEHIYYKRQAIAELLRVLKPGGLLALTFDLVEDLPQAGLTDDLRKEIFDLDTLGAELRAIGVDVMPFDTAALRRSVAEIQDAEVLGIPAGMTVGGVILRKVRGAAAIEA